MITCSLGSDAKEPERVDIMNFESYIGTKRIEATPMTRGEYAERSKRNSILTEKGESPADEGYLVKYSDDYQSWSPKSAFEAAYRKSGEMNFGHALEALKHGDRVARTGWNGKNMFLFLVHGKELNRCMYDKNFPYSENMAECGDSICMKTAQNTICIGWLASQTDMLAEDWEIII